MKLVIFVLILAAFLQESLISIDLVPIILITRTLVTKEQNNLILAFFIGLLVSHLSFTPLGLESLIFVLMVEVTLLATKIRGWSQTIIFFPLLLILLIINMTVISFATHQSLVIWPRIAFDLVFSIPVLFLTRLWEERFVVKPEVKLKV